MKSAKKQNHSDRKSIYLIKIKSYEIALVKLALTVYLYRDPIDFRKSFRGLALLVEQELGHDPYDGELFAFTNWHRNKIKCLFWEDNGFVLYYKSLSEDKFRWPRKTDELVTLTGQQLNLLLDGYDISLMKPHKKRHYDGSFQSHSDAVMVK